MIFRIHLCLAVTSLAVAGAPDKPRDRVDSCLGGGCHADIVTHRFMHGPTAQQKCMACHEYLEPRDHSFGLAEPAAQLCVTCHVFPQRTYVHQPVSQGNCTGCHDPHGSGHRNMLLEDAVGGLCTQCHRQSDQSSGRFIHGPVAAGACILCHDAHSSWQPALLTESPRDLCLECHAELAPTGDRRPRHTHQPVTDSCLTCHDAHASDFRYQLREESPDLCFGCHQEVGAELAGAAVVHGAAVQEGGCLACHSAHMSNLPALQRRTQPELCLDCHTGAMTATDGRSLTDMAALLRENPQHHGPLREGSCSACHQPHASVYPSLLRAAYPPEFYAPFDPERYRLCFQCHLPEMVEDRSGTGVTRFRDGDRNLHWLHVNREKGRTCRSCHEVHASKNPFHIRDAVPFGSKGWALEIRYSMTATGGSCAPGCHAPARYDRGGDP